MRNDDLIRDLAALIAAGRAVEEIAERVPSFGEEVAEYVDAFERSAWMQLRMRVARRAGVPLSEVYDRWTDEDLAAEAGWDAVELAARFRACSQCGIDIDHVINADGFPADDSAVKLEKRMCPFCVDQRRAEATVTDNERDQYGAHIEVQPRGPGDPYLDIS